MDVKKVGNRIKAARKAVNLTQLELATLVGLTTGAISQLEAGATTPRLKTLVAIAKVLKVRVAFLLGEGRQRGRK